MKNWIQVFAFTILIFGFFGCVNIQEQVMEILVVDASSNQPISGATVTVSYSSPGLPIVNVPSPQTTLTDSFGKSVMRVSKSSLWDSWIVRVGTSEYYFLSEDKFPEDKWRDIQNPFVKLNQHDQTLIFRIP